MVDQIRPGADVERDRHQRLIHRHDRMAKALDAFLRPSRPVKGFSKADAHVFDGVMVIDIEIAAGLEVEVKKPKRVNEVSIWSKNGMPVWMSPTPSPSSVRAIWISVSLVVREIDPVRVALMIIVPHVRINGCKSATIVCKVVVRISFSAGVPTVMRKQSCKAGDPGKCRTRIPCAPSASTLRRQHRCAPGENWPDWERPSRPECAPDPRAAVPAHRMIVRNSGASISQCCSTTAAATWE